MTENSAIPAIHSASLADLKHALGKGWQDFLAAPAYGLFFGGFFALGGLALVYAVIALDMVWLAYPLIIGFSLVGPFVATGLYEVSRRIEKDIPLKWGEVLRVIWTQRNRELGWMAFVTLFIFWIWTYQIRTLFAVFFGSSGFATFERFLEVLFTTQTGLMFLVVGHIVGAIISLVLFSLTVISFPLLLDREIDFVSAMLASLKTVIASPFIMLGWGVFVTLAILFATVPAFLGLLIVLPVLGHATWHLYRRVIN